MNLTQTRESFAGMWMHRRRVLSWLLLCFIAEVVSSWRVWYSFPNDNLRVGYPGFAEFEAGRLQFWVLMLVMIGLTGSAMTWLANRDSRSSGSKENAKAKRLWLRRSLYLVSAITLETGTSVVYWYWNRSRMPEIFGWPIFRFYLWGHLLPWAVFVSLGLFLWNRLAKGRSALYVMLSCLTVIAIYFMTVPHCVCTTCLVIDPITRVVTTSISWPERPVYACNRQRPDHGCKSGVECVSRPRKPNRPVHIG
jgi:hypothetical protein